jgi:hypothetical protein
MVVAETKRADRTLVFLKPDVLLMLDRVTLATAQPVQLRYQVFNDDGKGETVATGTGFEIKRPSAGLAASVHSTGSLTCSVLKHDLPESEGVHPFVEAVSAAATEHTLLTVAAARPSTESGPAGKLDVARQGTIWRVAGTHRGQKVNVSIDSSPAVPVITIV